MLEVTKNGRIVKLHSEIQVKAYVNDGWTATGTARAVSKPAMIPPVISKEIDEGRLATDHPKGTSEQAVQPVLDESGTKTPAVAKKGLPMPEQTPELVALKKKADELGIKYMQNIGFAKLSEKVNAK